MSCQCFVQKLAIFDPVPHKQIKLGVLNTGTYPDSRFREACPHRDLLPDAHIGVPVPGEEGFELLQLLGCEVGSLPSLTLLVFPVLRVVQLAVRVVRALAVVVVAGIWNQVQVAIYCIVWYS